MLPAVVTGLGPSIGFEWTVTVDAGRRDGVQADQTVIDSDGLVGRVKQVGESSAVVRARGRSGLGGRRAASPAATRSASPPATGSARSRTRRWTRRPGCRSATALVTGPYGGSTYVAGLPVGQVTAVSGDPGAAGPGGDRHARTSSFASLDLVGIVLAAPRADPRDRLAPPPPASHPGAHAVRAGPGAAAALAILVAVMLQAAVLSRLPLPGGPPNLVLVLVVAIGLAAGGRAGLAAGFAAGLLTDLLSDHPVGVLALCFALAGFVAGLLEADVRRSVLLPVVVVAVADRGGLPAPTSACWGCSAGRSPTAPAEYSGTIAYDVVLAPFVVPLVMAVGQAVRRR